MAAPASIEVGEAERLLDQLQFARAELVGILRTLPPTLLAARAALERVIDSTKPEQYAQWMENPTLQARQFEVDLSRLHEILGISAAEGPLDMPLFGFVRFETFLDYLTVNTAILQSWRAKITSPLPATKPSTNLLASVLTQPVGHTMIAGIRIPLATQLAVHIPHPGLNMLRQPMSAFSGAAAMAPPPPAPRPVLKAKLHREPEPKTSPKPRRSARAAAAPETILATLEEPSFTSSLDQIDQPYDLFGGGGGAPVNADDDGADFNFLPNEFELLNGIGVGV